MIIYYVDEIGETAVEVDLNNIQFCHGCAFFSSGGEEYKIEMNRIIEIITKNYIR